MKRRHFISFVFVLILCIGMIGCGKEKKTTASDKFQSDYMEIGVGTTVEKGYFGVINGLLYYVDFETMNAVPICNKPDCRHISWMEDRSAMRQILIFGTYFLIKENYTVFGLLLMAEVNWLYLIWTEATGNQKECLLRQKKVFTKVL